MLTTMKHATNRGATATPQQPAGASLKDLEFVSANQRLEGFAGEITEAVAAHGSNVEEIVETAKKFGAQVPSEKHRRQQPIFKVRGDRVVER